MKTLITILLTSFLIFTLQATSYFNELNKVIYISVNGDDQIADGSRNRPYRNIQPAINIAEDGDVLIVLEGRYTGPENRNLNFNGKSITLQSEFPDNNTCLNNTIIDAEGIGYVIRFINDEDLNSVFQGFSIIPGDTSMMPLKGIPGLIELLAKANPTTRRLKIFSAESKSPIRYISGETAITDYKTDQQIFIFDPFVQPFNISDYYGSGDVNKDGSLNNADLLQLDSILAELTSPNIRADVDGNGLIDADDRDLLDSAIFHNEILPAWWNRLTTEQEKNRWIDRILSVDETDKLSYDFYAFQCWNFATQIKYRAVQRISSDTYDPAQFYPEKYRSSMIDGGQTIYNLPIYYTTIIPDNGGMQHGINAVLTGSDPLLFDHWRFIEPQTDYDVEPGMWDMVYNSRVKIRDQFSDRNITFHVDETQTILDTVVNDDPRPYYYAYINPVNNYPFHYNPKLLANHPNYILYEKQRDDMTRIMDIFLSDLKNFEKPLVLLNHYSRLWDIKELDDDKYILLWSSKTDRNIQTIHTGTLDMNLLELTEVETITSIVDGYDWCDLELIIDSSHNKHVFLYTKRMVSGNAVSQLRYSNNISGVWSTVDLVTNPQVGFLENINSFNAIHYNNEILVFCLANVDLEQPTILSSIVLLRYNGSWHEQVILENYPIKRLCADADTFGRIHLVYNDLSLSNTGFYHLYSDNSFTWTSPQRIETTANRPYARDLKLLHNDKGEMFLISEERHENRYVPVWQEYSEGTWHEPNNIEMPEDKTASYTDASVSAQDILLMAWAARSSDSLRIERYTKCFNDPIITTEYISICEGENYLGWTESGEYERTLTSSTWCDSVVITHLSVNPIYQYTENIFICEGDSIILGGELQTTSGIYYDILTTINGCDSVIITELTVHPVYEVTRTEEICEGESIILSGEPQTTSGTYYDTLSTVNGCDSVIITELIINELPYIYLGNDTTISINDPIILDAGSGFSEYLWNTGSSDQEITLYNLNVGDHEYLVWVTNINNCVNSDTIIIHVVLPNLISSVFPQFNLEIFPNPTSDILIIKSSLCLETDFILTLVDYTGKVILKRKIEKLDEIELNLTNLKNGFYILRINGTDLVNIQKIIKN